jgi:hypothetical protein
MYGAGWIDFSLRTENGRDRMSRDNETPDRKQNKAPIAAEEGANVRREFLKGRCFGWRGDSWLPDEF